MENTYSLYRFCPYYHRNKAMAIKSNKQDLKEVKEKWIEFYTREV